MYAIRSYYGDFEKNVTAAYASEKSCPAGRDIRGATLDYELKFKNTVITSYSIHYTKLYEYIVETLYLSRMHGNPDAFKVGKLLADQV